MSLTSEQQDYLDSLAVNYAAMVTAFTAAAEAQNNQSVTTLSQVAPLRLALQDAAGALAGNLGQPGALWSPFCISVVNIPGQVDSVPIDMGAQPPSPLIL